MKQSQPDPSMNSPFPTSLKLLDSVPALLWQAGTDAKWNFFNKHWLHYRGRTLEQELGHGWVNGVHPGDRNTFVKAYLDHFDAAEPFAMEVRLRHRDGSYRWVVIHGQPVLSSDGAFTGYLGYGHDVTEQKRYFEDVRQSRHRFRALTDMSPSGIFCIDPEGNCDFVSDRWCSIAGIPRDRAMGIDWLDAIHPDDRISTEEALADCLNEITSLDLECRFRRDRSTTLWVLLQLRPEYDEQGILDGYFGSITDLSPDRSSSEDNDRRAVESLGIFTGNMAHDFNDLLTPILLNLGVAKSAAAESAGSDELLRRIEEAEAATLRAHGLARRLGSFAETEESGKNPSPLLAVLETAVVRCAHLKEVQAELTIDEKLWPVDIDESAFEEVVTDLLNHATHATAPGGAVRVTAMNLEERDYPGLGEVSGRHIAVSVEELSVSGGGEEFFPEFDLLDVTAELPDVAALETARSIVREFGGHLIIESEFGAPSSFTIVLPAARREPAQAPAPPVFEPKSRIGDGAHLLLMDDDELVRSSMEALLTSLGYQVETASDGAQALEIYRSAAAKGSPFDLTLMDLSVPGGMGGKEAVSKLKAMNSAAVTVVCSGNVQDPAMTDYEAYGFAAAIRKPFHPGELQSLLRLLTQHRD